MVIGATVGWVLIHVKCNLNGVCGSSSLSSCKYGIGMPIYTLYLKKEKNGDVFQCCY